MADEKLLIKLADISFGYNGKGSVLTSINLELRRNERLGLIGAAGSGKTTLLHIIMGLNPIEDGHIEVAGREITGPKDFDHVRQKVGFLFQNSEDQLFCPTVGEDVAFGPLNMGKTAREAEAIVADSLERLNISDLSDRLTHELSGGQKRLVALATVIAMKPDVLMLDEPTSSLDPRAKRNLATILEGISGTQVIASHDMEFVRSTCRRSVVISDGEILADGPTDDILANGPLMFDNGLEVPYSLGLRDHGAHDHHHGAGPAHGHGHDTGHSLNEHKK